MRSRVARAAVGLWSLWLLVALSDPSAVHDCPMHGGHAGHAGHAGHSSMTMNPAHAAAGMDMAPGAPTDVGPNHQHDTSAPHANLCTCINCGCTATFAMLAGAAPTISSGALDRPAPSFVAPLRPAVRPQHAQPFANGPPALTSL